MIRRTKGRHDPTRRTMSESDDVYDEDAAMCECGHVCCDHHEKAFGYVCCVPRCACKGFQGIAEEPRP